MANGLLFVLCVVFFKQKPAYEMLRSLVGSEMCIRDRNGIAYDPSEDRLFVTGKLWPSLFEIELVEDTKEAISYTHLTLPTIYSV